MEIHLDHDMMIERHHENENKTRKHRHNQPVGSCLLFSTSHRMNMSTVTMSSDGYVSFAFDISISTSCLVMDGSEVCFVLCSAHPCLIQRRA